VEYTTGSAAEAIALFELWVIPLLGRRDPANEQPRAEQFLRVNKQASCAQRLGWPAGWHGIWIDRAAMSVVAVEHLTL
jgi:hypothetical protein